VREGGGMKGVVEGWRLLGGRRCRADRKGRKKVMLIRCFGLRV
jgi:hypothetical protein